MIYMKSKTTEITMLYLFTSPNKRGQDEKRGGRDYLQDLGTKKNTFVLFRGGKSFSGQNENWK